MNNEFILSPQNFINNTAAPDYAARSRQDSKAFYTSSSSDANAEKKASFDAFMQDLKARNKQDKAETSDSNKTTQDAASSKEQAEKSAFLTRVAKTSATETIIDPSETEVTDEELSDIELKMAQILEALEKIKLELSKDTPKDTASNGDTIEVSDTDEANAASEIKILALLVNLEEDGQPLDTSTTDPRELLAQVMGKLRDMIEQDKEALIAMNKTPAQLAEIQKIVEEILKAEIDKQDDELLEKLAAQWSSLTLIPEQPKQQSSPAAEVQTSLLEKSKSTDAAPEQPVQKSDAQSRYEDRYKIEPNAKTAQNDNNSSADQDSSFNAKPETLNNAPADKVPQSAQSIKTVGEQFLQAMNDSVLAPPVMTAQGSLVYTDTDGVVLATTQSTTQASMVNLTTQATHASQPHPATQTVMATINKAIKTGETTELKIQLDPPELGRVEVKMSIDKNNITKVVLTSEKPETHMMLQRDAHILERVLQDSGLYNDSGISFELANDFNQNTPSGEQRDNSANGRSGLGNEEIIETTMDWEVDPRTGVMHYNILA